MNLLAKPINLHCSLSCGAFCSFGGSFALSFFSSRTLRVSSAMLEISDEIPELLEPWQPAAAIVHGCCAEHLGLKSLGFPCTGHVLCPVPSRQKRFHASWLHWVSCVHGKTCNSHELPVSGASAGNRKAPSFIRSSTLLRVVDIWVCCLSMWSATEHALVLLHS